MAPCALIVTAGLFLKTYMHMKCLHPEASCTQDVENLGPVCRDSPNVDTNPGGQRAMTSKAQEDQTPDPRAKGSRDWPD